MSSRLLCVILTIITSFMKIKWKALFPRFRLKAKLKKYIKIRSNEEEEKKKVKKNPHKKSKLLFKIIYG